MSVLVYMYGPARITMYVPTEKARYDVCSYVRMYVLVLT